MRISIFKVLLIFLLNANSFSADVKNEDSHIVVLAGSVSDQREKYYDITRKSLDESDVALLFMREDGYLEKEVRFKRMESEALEPADEFDCDVRVTGRAALISQNKTNAFAIENITEERSPERLAWFSEQVIDREIPEGEAYVHGILRFYDRFGNVLMEESKNDCNYGIHTRADFYSGNPRVFDKTFAISENGEKLAVCRYCLDGIGGGCFVYSPLSKQSLKLSKEPSFQNTASFSPNSRYFAFYHSVPMGITFLDRETKMTTEIGISSHPGLVRAFDNGTMMVWISWEKRTLYYDIEGNLIKTKIDKK